MKVVKTVVKAVVRVIKTVVAAIVKLIKAVVKAIVKIISSILKFISKIFGNIGFLILIIVMLIIAWFFPPFAALLKTAWGYVVKAFSAGWSYISQAFANGWGYITAKWSAWTTQGGWLHSAWGFVTKAWKAVGGIIAYLWGKGKAAVAAVADAARGLAKPAASLLGGIGGFLKDNPLLSAGLLAGLLKPELLIWGGAALAAYLLLKNKSGRGSGSTNVNFYREESYDTR